MKKLLRKIRASLFYMRIKLVVVGFLSKFKKVKLVERYGYPYNDQWPDDRLMMPVSRPTTPRDGFLDPMKAPPSNDLVKADGSPFCLTDIINHHINDKRETNLTKTEILQQASYAKTLIEQIETMCKDPNEVAIIADTSISDNIKKEI